ncbi:DUF445 family protein [Chitinispirillales bacterium ANBcel5]|uniref:DUF445 domain-containing protein n=1 Tax=Cellulosispirillum alkaliphilum TaxID=3039283 RepID=UPI002A5225E2|nr:DUF445 family protein [Chitinispirillales bacterium ANBcel5]
MENYYFYFLIPVISALIGWLTNYVAVRMIFRPRREIRILGIKFIGLIPKRKQDLAEKIADTIERELISHKDIRAIADSPEFHDKTGALIKTKIDDFICQKMGSNPLISMFVPQDMTSKISEHLVIEMKRNLPEIVEGLFSSLENKLDFRKIIKEKIEKFEIERLEKIVYDISSRELKSIEYLGGVLGFVVGIVQVTIFIAGAN